MLSLLQQLENSAPEYSASPLVTSMCSEKTQPSLRSHAGVLLQRDGYAQDSIVRPVIHDGLVGFDHARQMNLVNAFTLAIKNEKMMTVKQVFKAIV